MKNPASKKQSKEAQPRELVVHFVGDIPLIAPPWPMISTPSSRALQAKVEAAEAAFRRSKTLATRLVHDIEAAIGITTDERIVTLAATSEPWEDALGAAMGFAVANAVQPPPAVKKKPGRKASGLRDLSPEAARLAVTIAAVAVAEASRPDFDPDKAERSAVRTVRQAQGRRDHIAKYTGHEAPPLERILRQDLSTAELMVPDGQGGLERRIVVRGIGDNLERRMIAAQFDGVLIRVASSFAADVENSTVGRLTARYGESVRGGTFDPAFDQAVRMERLVAAQERLTPKERAAVWAFVVFGLPLQDIGWLAVGARLGKSKETLHDAAIVTLEAAFERMLAFYNARPV